MWHLAYIPTDLEWESQGWNLKFKAYVAFCINVTLSFTSMKMTPLWPIFPVACTSYMNLYTKYSMYTKFYASTQKCKSLPFSLPLLVHYILNLSQDYLVMHLEIKYKSNIFFNLVLGWYLQYLIIVLGIVSFPCADVDAISKTSILSSFKHKTSFAIQSLISATASSTFETAASTGSWWVPLYTNVSIQY